MVAAQFDVQRNIFQEFLVLLYLKKAFLKQIGIIFVTVCEI